MTNNADQFLESFPTTSDAVEALRLAVARMYAEDIDSASDNAPLVRCLLQALRTAENAAAALDVVTA